MVGIFPDGESALRHLGLSLPCCLDVMGGKADLREHGAAEGARRGTGINGNLKRVKSAFLGAAVSKRKVRRYWTEFSGFSGEAIIIVA